MKPITVKKLENSRGLAWFPVGISETVMAANSSTRGMMRPHHNRSPPFLVIGLAVVVIILGFNYWSLSSRNNDLAKELQDFQDKFRISALKKLSSERRSEQLVVKVQDLENIINKNKAAEINEKQKLAKDISRRNADVATMQDQLYKYKSQVIALNKSHAELLAKKVECPKCPSVQQGVTMECSTAMNLYRENILRRVNSLCGAQAAEVMKLKMQVPGQVPNAGFAVNNPRTVNQQPNEKQQLDVNKPNVIHQSNVLQLNEQKRAQDNAILDTREHQQLHGVNDVVKSPPVVVDINGQKVNAQSLNLPNENKVNIPAVQVQHPVQQQQQQQPRDSFDASIIKNGGIVKQDNVAESNLRNPSPLEQNIQQRNLPANQGQVNVPVNQLVPNNLPVNQGWDDVRIQQDNKNNNLAAPQADISNNKVPVGNQVVGNVPNAPAGEQHINANPLGMKQIDQHKKEVKMVEREALKVKKDDFSVKNNMLEKPRLPQIPKDSKTIPESLRNNANRLEKFQQKLLPDAKDLADNDILKSHRSGPREQVKGFKLTNNLKDPAEFKVEKQRKAVDDLTVGHSDYKMGGDDDEDKPGGVDEEKEGEEHFDEAAKKDQKHAALESPLKLDKELNAVDAAVRERHAQKLDNASDTDFRPM